MSYKKKIFTPTNCKNKSVLNFDNVFDRIASEHSKTVLQ